MVVAVVKNGVFVPRDPLPSGWTEGTEVEVEKLATDSNGIHPADAWMDEVEKFAAMQDAGDDQRMQDAIDEERRKAKEMARSGIA